MMKRMTPAAWTFFVIVPSLMWGAILAGGMPPGESHPKSDAGREPPPAAEEPRPSAAEARGRARLLHEAIHATLQYVHHEYYREDEGLTIPAATLKSVFRELARSQKVSLRWLVVNARAMNVDHTPRDEFEKRAVQALAAGKDEYELAENGVYRHAAAITLGSECLKCHLPNRTSTEDRAAGLVITIPIAKE
jgi:hypothetical protein